MTPRNIRRLVERRRQAWAEMGMSNVPVREMGPVEIEAQQASVEAFRKATAELTEALRQHGAPVEIDGVILRLNAHGDGPAFLHPGLFGGRTGTTSCLEATIAALDLCDEMRRQVGLLRSINREAAGKP